MLFQAKLQMARPHIHSLIVPNQYNIWFFGRDG
jgi:hypothetical protein